MIFFDFGAGFFRECRVYDDAGDEKIREHIGKFEAVGVAFLHCFGTGAPALMEYRSATEGYAGFFQTGHQILRSAGRVVVMEIIFSINKGMDVGIHTSKVVHK